MLHWIRRQLDRLPWRRRPTVPVLVVMVQDADGRQILGASHREALALVRHAGGLWAWDIPPGAKLIFQEGRGYAD